MNARKPRPKFTTVLALDGGGTRGMLSTMVLEKLEESIKRNIMQRGIADGDFEVDLADYFDLIAGTSIGSIIGLYLATRGAGSGGLFLEDDFLNYPGPPVRPGTPEGIEALFRLRGDDIFPPLRKGRIAGLKQMLYPRFQPDGLNSVLNGVFGDLTLADCQTSVVVPTFELNSSRPVDFWAYAEENNVKETGYTAVKVRKAGSKGVEEWDPDRILKKGRNFKLSEVAAASAAFPGLFPAADVQYPDGDKKTYADGGLIASNPTISALSFLRVQKDIPLPKIAVLSLGCGVVLPNRLAVKDAGFLKWIKDGELFPLFLDQKSEYIQSIVDGFYYKALGSPAGQYTRIQIAVDRENQLNVNTEALSSVDNAALIPELADVGRDLADASEDTIDRFVDDFLMA